MPSVQEIEQSLEQFAPLSLAEDWDNVGLLVGHRQWDVSRIMVCLTLTPATVREAIESKADFVVAHHPLPFQPVSRITCETTAGRMLLDLIAAQIAVYSPHTAFDSARTGINEHLALGLGLSEIQPICKLDSEPDLGSGRIGQMIPPLEFEEITQEVKSFLNIDNLKVVGENHSTVNRVAVACGSGGSFFQKALAQGCDCFITGEANFHTCLEAEARGVGLILTGHFASERFAVLSLAEYLSEHLASVKVWASTQENDPLRTQ